MGPVTGPNVNQVYEILCPVQCYYIYEPIYNQNPAPQNSKPLSSIYLIYVIWESLRLKTPLFFFQQPFHGEAKESNKVCIN